MTYSNSYIHIWSTFSPSLSNSFESPIEIELLQAFKIPIQKSFLKYGLFYILNKEVSWESVGSSSLSKCVLLPTGPTQLLSLSLPRINGKFNFFILNVTNFTGKVTLNFVYEKNTKNKNFGIKTFVKSAKNKKNIGLIKTIEINVQPNKKFLVPFYLFCEMSTNSREFNEIQSSLMPILDKSKSNSEIEFRSQIIECVHSIPKLSNINFLRTLILPIEKRISLQQILHDYNLSTSALSLRFYVGGSTTIATPNGAFVNYWNQLFIGYDKTTGKKCPEISMFYTSESPSRKPLPIHQSFLPIPVNCNSILTLNLNQFDKNKIFVYCVFSYSCLQCAFPSGFFLISHLENNLETLLFRVPVFSDVNNSKLAVCFRIECVEDVWQIVPMRMYFNTRSDMEFQLDALNSRNWNLNPNNENITNNSNHLNESLAMN